jgi:hypothetical protein
MNPKEERRRPQKNVLYMIKPATHYVNAHLSYPGRTVEKREVALMAEAKQPTGILY